MDITLTEMEQAINYWREVRPSTGEESSLSPEVNVLASTYAMMIYSGVRSIAMDALDPPARQLVEFWRCQAK